MANLTRAGLGTVRDANFPTNNNNEITASDLRDWLSDGIDSFLTQKDKNVMEEVIWEAKSNSLTAGATTDLSLANGNFVHITGTTTTINSFGSCDAGSRFILVFKGIYTLDYDATQLILPGTTNITTANNDCCMIVSEGSGNWRIVGYFPISGGGGGGTVTAVTATTPLSSSGGTTPDISIQQASASQDGYLSSTDWNTFDGKQDALSAGTGISIVSNTITNTAPDQVVALTAGTGIGVTGTYPNFTIDNTSPGTMPGGADAQIQYNNGGTAFGGVSDLTWDDINNILTINTPRIGQSTGNGHFHMHTINTSPPSGLVDYITLWVDKSPKQVGYRFEQDTYTSAFQFNATSDIIYTFPNLSGTVALLSNAASFSSLTSTSSLTIGTPSATTGTIVLQNATNANTLTIEPGTTSASYTITMPPAASVGAQYLQSTGSGGVLQWTSGTTTGVSSIGTLNSATKNPNGAVISGSNIIMQTADATSVGLVSIGTQTFAGAKTFQAQVNVGNATYVSAALSMAGTTSNLISFSAVGNSKPTNGTTPTSGTKVVIYPSSSAATTDAAIGYSTASLDNEMWLSCRQNGVDKISFYNQTVRFGYWGNVSGIGSGLHIGETTTTGLLYMGSTTSNVISFADGGVAAPSTTTTRSAGSKIVIKNGTGNTTTDYAIGFNTNEMWLATPSAGTTSFYSNAARYARFGSVNSNTGLHLGDGATSGYLGFVGTSSNLIIYGDGGVGAPTSTSTRSAGYKLIVKGNFGNGLSDYGMGYNTDELWFAGGTSGGVGQVAFYLGFTTPRVTIANGFLNLASGFAYRINATQVVGARDTGYAAFTGTTNKGTAYATGTVTLVQLAERVAAIQASLTTHGLIGV